MDFTERMLERNRSRYTKSENKESESRAPAPLKEVHHNTVTTIASTSVDIKKMNSGNNKVTIETTVTMRKLPRKTSNPVTENVESEETTCTEEESESVEEKENDGAQDTHCPLRQDTKSRLQRLGVLYSDNPSRLSSPIHRTEETFLLEPQSSEEVPRSAKSSARSARLAALANTINHWEDDIRHHPIPERPGSKSPTKSSVLTKHSVFTNKNKTEPHRKFISPQKGTDARPSDVFSSRISSRNPNTVNPNSRRQTTPEKTVPSILKRSSDKRTSPQSKTKGTKTIAWDSKVIHALEAQGFSRSTSGQKITYDYNKDKSPSPTKSSPSVASGMYDSSIRRSPVKAASPPKPVSPVKLPSPVKSKSPLKAVSPVKGRYGSPIQMGISLMKPQQQMESQSSGSSEEEGPVPHMGVKQLRSPRKNPIIGTSPGGSVLDRAQRYEQATSPTKPRRDPAELPLAERMALFERNAGAAVLPKAPFGMPVPAKKLQEKTKLINQSDFQRKPLSQPSSQASGSTSSLQDRLAVFERGTDNSKKDHMRSILSEREKEIEMLKHRYDRYKGIKESPEDFHPSAPPPSPPPPPPLPSPPHRRRSSDYYYEEEYEKRGSSISPQQEKPGTAYPVLKEVKKIKLSPPKPGCIYPCLSDMEAGSETHESEAEEYQNNRSTSSGSSDDSDLNSLGQDIVKISRSSLKRDWPTDDQFESEMNEIDDFLDEALEESSDEPTPPKRGTYSEHQVGTVSSTSFEYSKSGGGSGEQSHPLLHTVSFYRKQQNMTLKPPSPSRHVQIDPSAYSTDDSIERMEEELDRELKLVEEKINNLQQEIKKQEIIILQTSQALNLCCSKIEFTGSTEQLEAEKLLLVASQRRQAALHEIQRLRVEQTLRPKSPGNKNLTERGSLSLSQITLPLRMDVIHQAAKEDQCYYLLCLVHSEEKVWCTNVMCAPRALHSHNKLTFPNTMTLDNLYSDFKVTLEVYTMTARNKDLIPHDVKYHINTNKKEASKLRLTPRKGKGENKLMASVQSPGGPYAVRTSSFTLAGYVIFSLREINRTQFSLNKVYPVALGRDICSDLHSGAWSENAYTSVLEGSMSLKIESEMCLDVEYRGFLTMFEDVSGFGAWHRRWCLLKGDKLSYWKYPEDERKKIALDTIELSTCTTQEVDVVPSDVCARLNTFLLETTRPARSTDVASLVLVRNGNQTTIRHLLSADTKEERIQWCQHLNKALALMRAWGTSMSK